MTRHSSPAPPEPPRPGLTWDLADWSVMVFSRRGAAALEELAEDLDIRVDHVLSRLGAYPDLQPRHRSDETGALS